ncbi:hypothetical protein AAFF_G00336040 [Aldrovandia affinis]|uniref:Uncharacterized protein n=1 Tax=Aldrovandia affinis TaxID=143900 RepID=A0AAD7WPL3_9TELE|nr:hypothetical protein AAFF_G00336040 [Aldrovandia affinis]
MRPAHHHNRLSAIACSWGVEPHSPAVPFGSLRWRQISMGHGARVRSAPPRRTPCPFPCFSGRSRQSLRRWPARPHPSSAWALGNEPHLLGAAMSRHEPALSSAPSSRPPTPAVPGLGCSPLQPSPWGDLSHAPCVVSPLSSSLSSASSKASCSVLGCLS